MSEARAEVIGGGARTLMAAGALSGAKVRGAGGEKLGSVAEVMVEAGTGAIAYVVLAFGGWFGVGEKLLAVPWSAVAVDPENGSLTLELAKADLDNAKGFDKDAWPADADATLFPA